MISQFIIIKKHGNKTSDKAGCADRLGRKQTIKTKFKTGDGYFCTLHAYLVCKKKSRPPHYSMKIKKKCNNPYSCTYENNFVLCKYELYSNDIT